ncbi:MAG TPA: hypothetical protein VGC24_01985, partial [Burkholderiaceae bacterium]
MSASSSVSRHVTWATLAAACGVLAGGAGGLNLLAGQAPHTVAPARQPMLLAPMIGVFDSCVMAPLAKASDGADSLARACGGPQGSAAALVDATLSQLQPAGSRAGPYSLGYTLPVPLLHLFQQDAGGSWSIDHERVMRLARTVRDSAHPVILYLFSNHFSSDAPLEKVLAANPANLAQTRDGPLAASSYYGAPLYNWSFASTQTEITQRRVQAVRAVLDEVCKLGLAQTAKIRGVTLLGELHHLFPDFQAGMGFDAPYRVTDYSPVSVVGFRAFLQQRFGRIDALNRAVGADYQSFAEVEPPSKDIRSERLSRFVEHIDSFAQGSLPIIGWAHASQRLPGAGPLWVHVYRDGAFIGKQQVHLSRQDVRQAKPEFGDADTGWRVDMDFRQLPAGLHRIDVFVEQHPGVLTAIGSRQVAIMDRRQQTPQLVPQAALPASVPADGTLAFYIDMPADLSSYYYNPLVPLWHAFRQQQVVHYLAYFDGVVRDSCLAGTPRYTHQIVPFSNPSWDANKFAIQQSLLDMKDVHLGVSLYGETTYGTSFLRWYAGTAHQDYGITEFHPLKAMEPAAMQSMLARHAAQGAGFLSFFLEPYWQGARVPRAHNMFSLDPYNEAFGSDALYEALRVSLARAGQPAQNIATPTMPAA